MLQIDQEIQSKNDGNRKKPKVALFYFYSSIPSLNAARTFIIMYKLFITFCNYLSKYIVWSKIRV